MIDEAKDEKNMKWLPPSPLSPLPLSPAYNHDNGFEENPLEKYRVMHEYGLDFTGTITLKDI